MKMGSVFFGSFFIALGGLFLAKNLGLSAESADGFAKLWPLILIALGASYLVSNDAIAKALSATSGVFAGVIAWTLIQNPMSRGVIVEFDNDNPEAETQSLVAFYDGKAPNATCKLAASVGEFSLKDATTDLLRLDAKTTFGGYELRQTRQGDRDFIEIEKQDRDGVAGGKMTHKLALALNPNPLWTIEADIGAAKLDFDLSPFRVQRVEIEAGATLVTLKLGARCDSVQVRLSTAASTVKLLVPKESGCEILGENDFSSRINAKGFVKQNGAKLQTENFSNAQTKIYVTLESGLSTLNVERY